MNLRVNIVIITCLWFADVSSSQLKANDESALNIAAFNIQIFGENKMNDEVVKTHLVNIVRRYDLVLIQEIRQAQVGKNKVQAIVEFLTALNKQNSADGLPAYKLTVSERLGRSTSKEQYAFIYREDWLEVDVQDGKPMAKIFDDRTDEFEREPYYVQFTSKKASLRKFVAFGIHTKPDDAENEIGLLKKVYDTMVSEWGTRDAVIMGDFNGGCDYTKSYSNNPLATSTDFYWLIDDKQDTTVKSTDCAYDRIVVTGTNMLKAIIPGSPRTYQFTSKMDISQKLSERISDHYPVEFAVFSKSAKADTREEQSFFVGGTEVVASYKRKLLDEVKKKAKSAYIGLKYTYSSSGRYESVTVYRITYKRSMVIGIVEDLAKKFPTLITLNQMYAIQRNFRDFPGMRNLGEDHAVYQTYADYFVNLRNYKVELVCKLKPSAPISCGVRVTFSLKKF